VTTAGLRLLTWNVRGLRDDLEALHATVRSVDPHVVAIQEAPRVVRRRTRAAELARRCGLVVVTGGRPAAGNLLLSSIAVEVDSARDVRLPNLPGRQSRGAVVARLALAGRRFAVVGTHLGLDAADRVVQLDALIELFAPLDEPVVVLGDLNEPPGGAVTSVLGQPLVDAAGDDATPTFPTRGPRRRIDQVWVDRRLPVRAYQVIDTAAARRASDHLPVLAEVELG